MAERRDRDHETAPSTKGTETEASRRTETTDGRRRRTPTHRRPAPPPRRRGPDPLTLLVGLATLAMAVFAFVGELPDLSGFDPRWLLAGGAAVVGLVLLVGSLRRPSGGRRRDG